MNDEALAADGAVEFSRCTECGEVMFPVQPLSPCGHEAPSTLHRLTEQGSVYAWTRVHQDAAPLIIAMADFMGGAIRVTAPMPDAETLSVGDPVVVRSGLATPYVLVRAQGQPDR